MSNNSYSSQLDVMLTACEKTTQAIIRDFFEIEKLQISKKGINDFVTTSDLKAERSIIKELCSVFQYPILLEESGEISGNIAENPIFATLHNNYHRNINEGGYIEKKRDNNGRHSERYDKYDRSSQFLDVVLNDDRYKWIVDPIDGTSNFIHGNPNFVISIALQKKNMYRDRDLRYSNPKLYHADSILSTEQQIRNNNNIAHNIAHNIDHNIAHDVESIQSKNQSIIVNSLEDIVAGIVYLPVYKEYYWAIKGSGAYHVDAFGKTSRIRCANKSDFSEMLSATVIGTFTTKQYRTLLQFLQRKYVKLRVSGSIALDLAYLASGKFDLAFYDSANLWDLAAGVLIAKESGCAMNIFSGIHIKNAIIENTKDNIKKDVANEVPQKTVKITEAIERNKNQENDNQEKNKHKLSHIVMTNQDTAKKIKALDDTQ